VINTPSSLLARADEIIIRGEAISRGIPIVTTQDGAYATVGHRLRAEERLDRAPAAGLSRLTGSDGWHSFRRMPRSF
jgi:hypothetical protein